MAKQYGTTKSGSSSNPKGMSGSTLGGGKGIATGNSFSANAKISSFEGSTSMDGGYYSLMTKDGKYSMVIETTNGYNSEMGSDGTLIDVGIRKGTGEVEHLANSFVEGSSYRESMGYSSYSNDAKVAQRINATMPYFAELANNWIKKNK